MIALHNLEIPYRFPQAVIREAEEAGEVSLKGREDWRDIPLITIDPFDAKDHDDAVFAEPDTDAKNAGGHIVYVAIADVAAYVRPGTALDREAYLRGNSVYFPDRVVPMLPERISNDLCSLKEGVNRPALAVRMVIGAGRPQEEPQLPPRACSARPQSSATSRRRRRSTASPTTRPGPILDTVLKPLWAAYRTMTMARDKRGPLDLDLPERKIILDDQGEVADIRIPERLDAHRLIEEMMIAANVAAAETLEKQHSAADVPRPRLAEPREADGAQGIPRQSLNLPFPKGGGGAARPTSTASSPRRARRARSSRSRRWCCARRRRRSTRAENYGHFGLNLDRYAHFTSPIRRYADLIVHRALIAALDFGKDGLREGEAAALPGIAQHISSTERRAMAAERETADRLLAQFLSEPDRRKVRGPDFGRHPLRPLRPPQRHRRRRLHPGLDHRRGLLPLRRGAAGDDRRPHRRDASPSATPSRSGCSRSRRSPAPCGSSSCQRGNPRQSVIFKRQGKRPSRSYGPKRPKEVEMPTTIRVAEPTAGRSAQSLALHRPRPPRPLPAIAARASCSPGTSRSTDECPHCGEALPPSPRRRPAGLPLDRHRRPHRHRPPDAPRDALPGHQPLDLPRDSAAADPDPDLRHPAADQGRRWSACNGPTGCTASTRITATRHVGAA